MIEVKVDDLYKLWHAGAVDLPQIAVQYSELARTLHRTGLFEEAAFRRSIGGRGRLYLQWTRLRDLVQDDITVRSRDNLVNAGRALTQIADSYATTDYLSAEQIAQCRTDVEWIEDHDASYRRPPDVLDAPRSDDPHPQQQLPY